MDNKLIGAIQRSTFFFLLFATSCLQATGQTVFTLVPTTPTAMLMPANSSANIEYRVTNQTFLTRTLTTQPITGITQITTGTGVCPSPFTLASHQSCLLRLQVNGNQMPARITGGPVVCKTMAPGNNAPDPFLCSQPEKINQLAISLTQAIPDQHAYVTNWSGNSISLCDVNTLDGSFTNCAITASGGPTFDAPEAIGLNPEGTLLYVANIAGSSVSNCTVDSTTGALSLCALTGSPFNAPDGVALNLAGTYAYVSNASGNDVSVCQVDSITGALSANCTSSGTGFHTPSDMTLNSAGTIAYISNLISSTVSLCQIDSSTALLTCRTTALGFNSPEGITLHPSGQFAYITNNGDNSISLCQIHFLTGELHSCITTEGEFNGFGNLAFNTLGTRAYVPHLTLNKVSVCSVNLNTGGLSDCRDSLGAGFVGPSGLLLK